MARARRLPRGITRTSTGYLAQVMVRKHRRSARFPVATPIDEITDWIARTRLELRRRVPGGEATPHTFGADVATYLSRWHAARVHPVTRAQRERYLALWASVFGHRSRHSLKTSEIAAQLAEWRDHGMPDDGHRLTKAGKPKRARPTRLAPATVAKLRQAIYQVFALLDRGAGVINPVEAVELPPPRPLEPRGVPMATIDAVFAAMPASSTRDHLALVAYAGLRPSEIARIQPGTDVTRTGRQTVLLVRTAKGGTPSAQPLLPEAAEALERLQASGRLARYDSAVGGLALRRACTAAGVAPLRVYDLRHSFGTAVLQATDQRTAQAALRHASIQTTHRYTLSAVPERVAVALRLIGGRDTAAGKTPGRRRA